MATVQRRRFCPCRPWLGPSDIGAQSSFGVLNGEAAGRRSWAPRLLVCGLMSTGSIGELAVLIVVSWSVGRPHVRRAVHTFRFSSAATGQRVGVPPLISGWPAREKSPTSFTHTRVALALSHSLSVSPSDSIRPGAVAEASARCGCSRFLVQSYLHEGRCDDMEYIDSVDVPRFGAGRHAHSALSRFTSARLSPRHRLAE